MSIGYACLALAVPGSGMKTCIQANATEENLLHLIDNNLNALERIIDYNILNDILLFRISSDLIPFGSSIARGVPWAIQFAGKLKTIGEKIRNSGMRVSMHPGQYTILNSPVNDVVMRSILDLEYHTAVLTALNLDDKHKIVLHIGGAYGDKISAMNRFAEVYRLLDSHIKNRLVLENDDRIYMIAEVLSIAREVGAPVIFDNLHHAANPPVECRQEIDWIRLCSETWREKDGPQKLHYSQQNPFKKPGAHTQTIAIESFLSFYNLLEGLPVDIMLEVKDKNISAVKCICCTSKRNIRYLEEEWGRYKYLILEKSPQAYESVRKLLKNKDEYPALKMYQMIEEAMSSPYHVGHAINATEHVWGYFKNKATPVETKRYLKLVSNLMTGEISALNVKKYLNSLAIKYDDMYLLNGYYFYL